MKCVILCAGYATRLYPLTLNKPKALLNIKGKPLVDYIVEKIPKEVKSISIVSNSKFYPHFDSWSKKHKKVNVIDDGTASNETRLGGIGDLYLAIRKEKIDEDLLVLLGDNLFDFDLEKLAGKFNERKKTTIGVYEIDSDEIKKMGQVIVKDDKIMSFEEKSQEPKTNLAITGIYLFTRNDLKKIEEYMETDKPKDGPSYLIKDFMQTQGVYAFTFRGRWFDIGSKESYEEVNRTW